MSRDIAIERDESGRAVRLWLGRESTEGASVASGSVATLRTGIPCDFCGGEIPLSRRRGSERRFCSEKCRRDSWEKAHPRLDFTPAASELAHALRGRETKAARILARLREGPANSLELMRVGGLRYSARVCELRQQGYRIVTENHLDHATYRLEGGPDA
jgi:hypothetical protein